MDSSDESDGEKPMGRREFCALSMEKLSFLPETSTLKPQMESIFAEVSRNLPSIDFEEAQMSSDNDEPMVFNHNLKLNDYYGDDDKDIDTSQSDESLSALLSSPRKLGKNPGYTGPLYDNDAALRDSESCDEELDCGIFGGRNTQEGTVSNWAELAADIEKVQQRRQNILTQSEVKALPPPAKPQEDKPKPVLQNWVREGGEQESTGTNMDDFEQYLRETQAASSPPSSPQSESMPVPKTPGKKKSGKKEEKERRKKSLSDKHKKMEKDLLSKIVSPDAPILSMESIQNIDLDMMLERLNNEDNQFQTVITPRAQLPSHSRLEQGAGDASDVPPEGEEHMTLIERLAMLSMLQSGSVVPDIDPHTGALLHIEESSTHKSAGTTSASAASSGSKKASLGNVPEMDQGKSKDAKKRAKSKKKKADAGRDTVPETVFIDLRNFEKNREKEKKNVERVQQILNLTPEREDSSDSDSEDQWQEQRRKIKQSLTSRGVSTDPLPNKPRPPAKKPQRVLNLQDQHSPRAPGEDAEGWDAQSDAASAAGRAQRQAELEAQRKKEKQVEAARRLREQKEREREARIRLAKQLETAQPSASVASPRLSPAEATPPVFDVDASYEPAPRSLPGVLSEETECLLLTVYLASNGQIILHRNKTNKSVDTGEGFSASYVALLTWLLSLVPSDFSHLQQQEAPLGGTGGPAGGQGEGGQPSPPFQVVGLQQAFVEEQLSLVVAVTPPPNFPPRPPLGKGKKSKLKDELRDSSAFAQHLSRLLTTSTLQSVCPWLLNLEPAHVCRADSQTSSPESPASASQKEGFVYRPPLPCTTTKPLSTFLQLNPDPRAARKVFGNAVGFFWYTMESDTAVCDQNLNDANVNYETQNSMSLIYKKIYKDPTCLMGILSRVLQEGLDLCGVRLLYPTAELLSLHPQQTAAAGTTTTTTSSTNTTSSTSTSASSTTTTATTTITSDKDSDLSLLNHIGPVLAIALRGTFARSIWLDAVGPSDPVLARRTDPNSLCALYGGPSRDECLLFCPRNQYRVNSELARWFGGRVPPGGVIDLRKYRHQGQGRKEGLLRSGSPKGRKGKKGGGAGGAAEVNEDGEALLLSRPPATLTATSKSDIFLVLSPLLPASCLGLLLSTCQRRGYQLRGVRRSCLTMKRSSALGIQSVVQDKFCPGLNTFEPESLHLESTAPATILLLRKENAAHNAASLIEAFMMQMTLIGFMDELQESCPEPLTSQHLFHASPYTDGLLAQLGGDFSKCGDFRLDGGPGYLYPRILSNPEMEQMAVLLLLGHDNLKSCGLFVAKLLDVVPYHKTPGAVQPLPEGFELLGLKWLPTLKISQAKEVTPFELGAAGWKESVHQLTTQPVLVLALRGVDAFRRLEPLVPSRESIVGPVLVGRPLPPLTRLLSQTADEAYTLARLFFSPQDLYPDPQRRPLLPYLPQARVYFSHVKLGGLDESPPSQWRPDRDQAYLETPELDQVAAGPLQLATLLLLKPGGMLRRHQARVMRKLAQEGFAIVGLRQVTLTPEEAARFVPVEDRKDGSLRARHLQHLTSGTVLLLVLQRENAVKALLELVGPEDPLSARRRSQFFWRGVFGVDSVNSGLYCSASYLHAMEDIKTFFPAGLCTQPTSCLTEEMVSCPAQDHFLDLHFMDHREIVRRLVDTGEQASVQASSSATDVHQLLQQTTCLLLAPPLFQASSGRVFGFVEVLESLVAHGFEMVGARMLWLTQTQAEHFLHISNAGSFEQAAVLKSGPSLVLALERDNAVVAFDALVGGSLMPDTLLNKYGHNVYRPHNLKQAHRLLTFFFEELVPGSQMEIRPKTEASSPAKAVTSFPEPSCP